MDEWLDRLGEWAILGANFMALVFIAYGTLEAFLLGGLSLAFKADGHRRGEAWLRFGRWLVAGLTFQLAADIIETSIATSWTDLGRLAATAVIRTFLNYFLERDLREAAEHRLAPSA